jgi:hypothetical protein
MRGNGANAVIGFPLPFLPYLPVERLFFDFVG